MKCVWHAQMIVDILNCPVLDNCTYWKSYTRPLSYCGELTIHIITEHCDKCVRYCGELTIHINTKHCDKCVRNCGELTIHIITEHCDKCVRYCGELRIQVIMKHRPLCELWYAGESLVLVLQRGDNLHYYLSFIKFSTVKKEKKALPVVVLYM